MLIVCTKDPAIIQATQQPASGAAQWGNVFILNPYHNQLQANAELALHLSALGKDEPLCLSAHGNNNAIGDAGNAVHDWTWSDNLIASLLKHNVGLAFQGAYLGTILIHACANNVVNFSANLAVDLQQIQALNGVWIYGYNLPIDVHTHYPNPNNLAHQVNLQGTQVLFHPVLAN